MICSSEKRFFTSNLLEVGNWTPNRCATQTWGGRRSTMARASDECVHMSQDGRTGGHLANPSAATSATGVRCLSTPMAIHPHLRCV
ncbi:hypothetical protein EYC54_01720 [Xanthomonas oryzae]|nr:hypothetical protein EYC54_01720 [Xanthomonas oryzae]